MPRAAGILISAVIATIYLGDWFPSEARAQEVFNRIPEVIVPEAHGSVRHETNGSLVRLGLTPGDIADRLNVELSRSCAQLIFNQSRQGRYFTIVAEEDGGRAQRYGFATGRGLNLRDPTGQRDSGSNYLFYRDGTSECRVYELRN